MKKPFRLKKLAIVGLGLMGGSLGLAARRRRVADIVAGFARRRNTRQRALRRRVVDEAPARLERAVIDADLVVFCTPVGCTAGLVEECVPFLSESCVVSDVGSSKREIVARLEVLPRRFVGAHPIAGSEQHGLDAASADLYDDAVVVLTPTRKTDPGALRLVRNFWSALGAEVELVSPGEHDDLMARTSHLPHLVAAILASHVGRTRARYVRRFCGRGFLDSTRIAEGDPDLWEEIVASNSAAIAGELDMIQREIGRVGKLLKKGDHAALLRVLELGRERRRMLVRNSESS